MRNVPSSAFAPSCTTADGEWLLLNCCDDDPLLHILPINNEFPKHIYIRISLRIFDEEDAILQRLFRTLWSSLAIVVAAAITITGLASAGMKIADFLANAPVICGSLPLGRCTGEFLVDHIKAGLTRSCDARLLPATRALHRDRLRRLRGNSDAWIIRYVREHKTRLADCRVEKSASGSVALQSPICIRLRESGYLLAQLNISDYRGLVAETEAELGCEYEKRGDRDKMASRTAP